MEQGYVIVYGAIRHSSACLHDEGGDADGIAGIATYDLDDVTSWLHRDACRRLPLGSRYVIATHYPTNYGRTHAVGWHHWPDLASADAWNESQDDPSFGGRYVTHTRHVVPATDAERLARLLSK